MRPTLGTSRLQRQVLYSTSKGVNSSSVSLLVCVFFVATYRKDLISVRGHKKNTDLQKSWNIYVFVCSHSVLPTNMTYEYLFNFFWESHSGWPKPLLYKGRCTIITVLVDYYKPFLLCTQFFCLFCFCLVSLHGD